MRAVKQCVIGQPTMKTPIIYWVQLQALIHSQPLYVNSKMIGEETKRQILEKKGVYRMLSSRQSVVARMRLVCLRTLLMKKAYA